MSTEGQQAAGSRHAVWPFGLAGRYVDDYGTEHLLVDDGGALLESAVPLNGEDPDGTQWSMTYWLPRDAVDEVQA